MMFALASVAVAGPLAASPASGAVPTLRVETDDTEVTHAGYEPFYEQWLRGMGHDVSDEGLIALLNHETLTVREYAVIVLGQRKVRAALPYLHEALKDAIPTIQVEAARSLGAMGDYSGIEVAKEALGAIDWFELPLIAAGVLGELDDLSGYPLLYQALYGENKEHRFRAVVELPKFAKFTGRSVEKLRIDPKADLLHVMSADADPFIRENAAYALGRFLSMEDVDDLEAAKASANEPLQTAIGIAIELIRQREAGDGNNPPPVAHEDE